MSYCVVTVSAVSVVLLYVCVDYNIVLCNIDDFLHTAQGLLMNFGMKCLLLHNDNRIRERRKIICRDILYMIHKNGERETM